MDPGVWAAAVWAAAVWAAGVWAAGVGYLSSSSMTAAGRRLRRAGAPTLRVERELWSAGSRLVAGVDEVGRGSWAGPLVIGAAILPPDRRVNGVRDSKMLSEAQREKLFARVASWCVSWSVGAASQEECDALGMAEAQRLAARRAINGLSEPPDHVLIDGNWDFVGTGNTTRIVRGDATCLSIAAASILAKVSRDRMMRAEAENYPGYDFEYNKGYPCPRHKMALQAYGPSAIHRRSWVFMEGLAWGVAGARQFARETSQSGDVTGEGRAGVEIAASGEAGTL